MRSSSIASGLQIRRKINTYTYTCSPPHTHTTVVNMRKLGLKEVNLQKIISFMVDLRSLASDRELSNLTAKIMLHLLPNRTCNRVFALESRKVF